MENTKKTLNTIYIVIVSLCLAVSLLILFLFIVVSIDNSTESIDPEYAMYVTDDTVVTKRYDIEKCEILHFFDAYVDGYEGKRTLFSNAEPKLKIVNDSEYYIEVTANTDLHDILDITTADGKLVIDCEDAQYNRVHANDSSYDYDCGLYVDCTELKITVHAPISELTVNTNLELDYDVAKADNVEIYFSFDGVKGVIYNIDAEKFSLNCSGSSELELIGEVHDTARITLYHNSRVNAKGLSANNFDTNVSRGIGGFSYILRKKWYQFECDIIGPTNILDLFIIVPPIVWIYLEVRLINKRKKLINQDSISDVAR